VKCVINDHVMLSRAPDNPIAAHIKTFAESRTALNYAKNSIQQTIRLAAKFSH
jgi:hypothetical protein